MEPLYTLEEAAQVLKVSERSLAEWLRKGKIRGVKIGRAWRIPESALDEVVRDGMTEE